MTQTEISTKELLTIEFRYNIADDYKTKTVTIGIYNTIDEAIDEGNKVLNILSKTFEVRADNKFKPNHLWGFPQRLVVNTCCSSNGIECFEYFAKITLLTFDDLNQVVNDIIKDTKIRKKRRKKETNE